MTKASRTMSENEFSIQKHPVQMNGIKRKKSNLMKDIGLIGDEAKSMLSKIIINKKEKLVKLLPKPESNETSLERIAFMFI